MPRAAKSIPNSGAEVHGFGGTRKHRPYGENASEHFQVFILSRAKDIGTELFKKDPNFSQESKIV